jgi:hypothetical protein
VSPRQGQQLAILSVAAVLFIAMLISGPDALLGGIGLIACLVASVATIRYYRKGGLPLDRGGKPFWRR